jgi:ribosome maturation protein Sdo1
MLTNSRTTPTESRGADLPGVASPIPTNRPLPTFTIHALIDDFPFDVSFSGSTDQLAATVERLRAIGAVPPTVAARLAVQEEKERGAPVCQFHGPMKESSKKAGSYYCPAKMGDGTYCKSTG